MHRTDNSKAVDVLINKVVSIVEAKMKRLKYDETFKSTVWKINDDGTYAISYKGQLYNVPNATKSPLTEGQSVWVKIPSGIFRNMYIDGLGKGNISSTPQDIDDVVNELNALKGKVNNNTTAINNITTELDGCITLSDDLAYEELEVGD